VNVTETAKQSICLGQWFWIFFVSFTL